LRGHTPTVGCYGPAFVAPPAAAVGGGDVPDGEVDGDVDAEVDAEVLG
jgi:hypothetical protein